MIGTQIDIEDLIASSRKPPTIRQLAEQLGLPTWRVYAAAENEDLQVNREARPMTVSGGFVPLTRDEWKALLMPTLSSLPAGVWGFGDGALTIVDRQGQTHDFKQRKSRRETEDQARAIQRLPHVRRIEKATA